MCIALCHNWHLDLIKRLAVVLITLSLAIRVAMSIRSASVSLRINRMVDLRQLSKAQFQFDLVFHICDECERLNELRGFSGTSSSQVLEVGPG